MKVLRKKALKNKIEPTALNIKFSKGIYSKKDFKEKVNYERIRADRNGSVFSIILFFSEELYKTKKNLNQFISKLTTQIRLIDYAGWYDKHYIAILLPETDGEGAVILGNKIMKNVDFRNESTSLFKVYTYPDNWLKHGVNNSSGKKSKGRGSKGLNISACIEGVFTIKMPLWKRAIDIAGASIGLVIAFPLFLLLSLYIKFISPGPVFFKQTRIGYKGIPFDFWKFRTMKSENNQSFHGKHSQSFIKNGDIPMEKLDDHDPRIFYGGRVIRKSCVDELPQLWNILKGDMSLVGPRPCIPYEAEEYLRWHTHRFDVVPGLTGLWQVSGKNKLTFKQMIRLDINYSKNLSFWNDIRIIFATPFTILGMVAGAAVNKYR
ncbi:MAG: sugar transferase, partial [Spirochaetes bacterium]|nr:sugar transferase [Spirochaetota bacterium]